MLPIPQDVLAKFDAILRERAVPAPFHADYRLGTKSSRVLPQRSKCGTIPEKHSSAMRIGAASFRDTCETRLPMR